MVSANLVKRIVFAVIAIPAVVFVAWLGRWWMAGLLAAVAALGAREVYGFARAQGIAPLERLGLLGAAVTPLAVAWPVLAPGPAAVVVRQGFGLALWLLVVIAVALVRRGPDGRPLAAVAVTVFGVLYAGWLLSFAILLRHPLPGRTLPGDAPVGMALLFYPLVLTWAGDTAAMAAGKAFGGPRLAPRVSPNKTWAGGVGGLFTTVALSAIYAATVFRPGGITVSLGEALVFGAVISVVGQLGDVAESLFKREVGVKDSSTIIPGHGGVLDRLDALYFVLPVTVMMFRMRGLL